MQSMDRMNKSANETDILLTKSRIRIVDLQTAKSFGQKWAMLTSYDATSARIFDEAKIPCLLIGDSASQVVLGYKSTVSITVDELIPMARAVASSCRRALVIADLPFGSYRESPKQALRTAVRFMKEANVHGVKIEGGREIAPHVELLTKSGIPVMAHIGLTPQSEHTLSGYKVQGKSEAAIQTLLEDAQYLQDSGAFSLVVELVPSNVGNALTKKLDIPVIGIGAGPDCDAQILVWSDMAGFTPPLEGSSYLSEDPVSSNEKSLKLSRVPKFIKRYANFSQELYNAAIEYANDVRSGVYPAEEHSYT